MSNKSRRKRVPGAARRAEAKKAETEEALAQLRAKKKAEAAVEAGGRGEPKHLVSQSLIQAIATYIGKSTGPVSEAMVIVQALQMSQPVPPEKLALIEPKPVDEAEALRQEVAELKAKLAEQESDEDGGNGVEPPQVHDDEPDGEAIEATE